MQFLARKGVGGINHHISEKRIVIYHLGPKGHVSLEFEHKIRKNVDSFNRLKIRVHSAFPANVRALTWASIVWPATLQGDQCSGVEGKRWWVWGEVCRHLEGGGGDRGVGKLPVKGGMIMLWGGNSFNIELYLQSLFGLHVHSGTHLLRSRKPTHPPAFGLIYEGAIGLPR